MELIFLLVVLKSKTPNTTDKPADSRPGWPSSGATCQGISRKAQRRRRGRCVWGRKARLLVLFTERRELPLTDSHRRASI